MIMPLEVREVCEPNAHAVGVEKTVDSTVVGVTIPLQRREDSRFIILSALETLREHFPYQPFRLSWDYPTTFVNEHELELSTAN
jgi:hypothetical protein